MNRVFLAAMLVGTVLGACTSADEGDDDGATEGALTCEHGMYSPCACSDGSMGTQLCAHDTSGFEECMCGGGQDTTEGDSGSIDSGAGPSTTEDSGPADTSEGTTTDVPGTSGTQDTGPIGSSPTAMIDHPGPEDRQAGVPIAFIGVANDPEDGALSGMSMVWTDDLEGPIGEGEMFDAALDVVGDHTVTLTATDSDGNVGEAVLTFAIVP
jgi:hypothetical protein